MRTPILLSLIALAVLGVSSTSALAADPLSDADGDGLPYKWEAAAPALTPVGSPRKCAKGKVRRKGKCVKRCGKGKVRKRGMCVKRCSKARVLKKGKCVKRKARKKKSGAKKARMSAVAAGSLHKLGANPNRKDLFVQIDFASVALRQSAACSQLDALYDAFAKAPVANPNGSTGIALHLDAGKSCPSRSYDLGGSRIFNAGACPNTSQVFNALQLAESRVGAFRLAGLAPTCGGGGGEGGAAQQPGITSVVYTDGTGFAMPFMHELGHNLGLGHGPRPQPNRLSVMNGRLYTSTTGSGSTEVVDYQRFALPALNEASLSEPAGIGAPPQAHAFYIAHWCTSLMTSEHAWPGDGAIDWDCDPHDIGKPPVIDPDPVAADIDGDGLQTVLPATGNEWLQLDYDAGGAIGP
jgi:hypothetical protein